MNMYRHDSLYRQRGLATSSANLDSTIPLDYLHILYVVRFSSTYIQLKTKYETFPGYEFITFN